MQHIRGREYNLDEGGSGTYGRERVQPRRERECNLDEGENATYTKEGVQPI